MKHGTLTKLAKAAGITPQTVWQIKEETRPSWPTAKKLAAVTGAPAEVFLDGDKAQITAAIEAWEQSITDTTPNVTPGGAGGH
jgi:DNA-binding XRE family transcriptional regulator